MPPGMASPRSSELASPTRRVSPWPHGSRICSGGAAAHSLSKCACLPPRLLGGSAPWLSTPSFGMPIRLDLSAPVERTYAPDRKAIVAALRIVLRLPQSRPHKEV